MPAPTFEAIDHLHLAVRDRPAAEAWMARVLGLRRVAALSHWAAQGGPLTLADPAQHLHLAVFESPHPARAQTIALRIAPAQAPVWREHLARELPHPPRHEDHGLTESLYFHDPDGNPFEITWLTGEAP